ncbi:hypothetical protein BST61_g1177 [Cercospora zeina]
MTDTCLQLAPSYAVQRDSSLPNPPHSHIVISSIKPPQTAHLLLLPCPLPPEATTKPSTFAKSHITPIKFKKIREILASEFADDRHRGRFCRGDCRIPCSRTRRGTGLLTCVAAFEKMESRAETEDAGSDDADFGVFFSLEFVCHVM